MVCKLTIEVSEEVYASLVEIAQGTGRMPETLVEHWLSVATHHDNSTPLPAFVGAISSNVPDWAENHDYYIGQALIEEMHPTQRGDSEVA